MRRRGSIFPFLRPWALLLCPFAYVEGKAYDLDHHNLVEMLFRSSRVLLRLFQVRHGLDVEMTTVARIPDLAGKGERVFVSGVGPSVRCVRKQRYFPLHWS